MLVRFGGSLNFTLESTKDRVDTCNDIELSAFLESRIFLLGHHTIVVFPVKAHEMSISVDKTKSGAGGSQPTNEQPQTITVPVEFK